MTITHELLETNYDRLLADLNQVDVLDARYRIGADNIRDLLLAQRQLVNSATEFYSSLSQYNLAIRDFHREKGSLLAYNNVQLAEGPWAKGAKYDAYRAGRFLRPSPLPGAKEVAVPVTSRPFDPSAVQDTSGPGLPMSDDQIQDDLQGKGGSSEQIEKPGKEVPEQNEQKSNGQGDSEGQQANPTGIEPAEAGAGKEASLPTLPEPLNGG